MAHLLDSLGLVQYWGDVVKYRVSLSQWLEMAAFNDAEQVLRFGTTRSKLMELALTTEAPTTTELFPIWKQTEFTP